MTNTSLQIYCYVLNEFLKSLNISQSYGGKADCLKQPVCRGIVLLTGEELAYNDVWRAATVVTASR